MVTIEKATTNKATTNAVLINHILTEMELDVMMLGMIGRVMIRMEKISREIHMTTHQILDVMIFHISLRVRNKNFKYFNPNESIKN